MTGKTIFRSAAFLIIGLTILGCTNAASAFLVSEAFVPDAVKLKKKEDYPVRKEIRQIVRLSPNAAVDASGIEGAVEVETRDGDTAEISFVREAKTQADFDCETIGIEQSAEKLVIRHQTKNEKQCRVIQAREHLKLVVPRSVNLSFENIEGDFTVGATEGFLRLDNIEGEVRIAQAQAAEINSIESNVLLNVAEINARGISISNIEGAVELGVKANLNADLEVNSSNVQINIPNAMPDAPNRKNYRLQLGAGGNNISISNIEGGVKIRGI